MTDSLTLNPFFSWFCRLLGSGSLALGIVVVVNNFLTYGYGLPSPMSLFGDGFSIGALFQVALIAGAIGFAFWFPMRGKKLSDDAILMDFVSTKIITIAFWAVLMVGIADAVLSFLRVEDLHVAMFGQDLATKIGLASWRGAFIHIPIMLLAVVIGMRDKSVSVVWLILLVVLAELLIVIARFVFAYEQTFMGDLVRFWYAALFLFASAFTLKEEGHVRVDVIFAGFRERTKAWVNATGTAFFGIPLCWIILWRGLSGKSSLINSPMLNFETSMSGFGMYVKYLMAAFLVVFALSMLAQFTSYFLSALSVLDGETPPKKPERDVDRDTAPGSSTGQAVEKEA